MKKPLLPLAVLLLVLAPVPGAYASPIAYTAVLAGSAESPPNASPGTGIAMVVIDTAAHTMQVDVTFADVIGLVTASHIHCCTAVPFTGNVGVATTTPTFTGFPSGVTAGTYSRLFDMSLPTSYNPAFITGHGGTPGAAEVALAAGLANGTAYLNIHTDRFAGGEIRGFLTPAVPEPASIALFGTGLAAVLGRARRKRRP
jgi:hypothetical protein